MSKYSFKAAQYSDELQINKLCKESLDAHFQPLLAPSFGLCVPVVQQVLYLIN